MADDPREQIQSLVADARRDFATDVDALLVELGTFGRSLGESLGEVSRGEALQALRAFVLEKFDQRLPLKSSADPVLLQLVRDAYRLLNFEDLLSFANDRREWNRLAQPFVERELNGADVLRLMGKVTARAIDPDGD